MTITTTTRPAPAWASDPASGPQLAFLDSLIAARDLSAADANFGGYSIIDVVMDRMDHKPISKGEASAAIGALKQAPLMPAAELTAPATLTAAAAPTKITQDGMYQRPDGTVVKVQVAVHGSGHLYAKVGRIVPEGERRTVRGKERVMEFDYTPGAMQTITPAMRMDLEAAKAFGALYGCCCNCGATLTDETSIERGMGPICAGKFA